MLRSLIVAAGIMCGGSVMGKSDLVFVDYEGPADLGRVTMRVGRNFAQVSYEHHPMVKSKTKPWSRKVDLTDADTELLLTQAQSAAVKNYKCETLTLMPGQDVTLKSLRLSVGKSPPYFSCEFVETPATLKDLVESLGRIYRQVSQKKD
jgi:hypothetical protein